MKFVFLCWLFLTFAGPLWQVVHGGANLSSDYRTANRESAHIAPTPTEEKGAVIQAYAARAFSWRGIFANHCWISVKPKNAGAYTVYQVIGWRTWRGLPALSISEDLPDRVWFDAKPKLILDVRGEEAERLIPKIEAAAKDYPYAAPYHVWPGPNSNTFPAFVARAVPELKFALPADALGKDFLGGTTFFAKAPSGTGYQFSLFGIFGVLIAKEEGFEINLLGLVYGVKFSPFAILLPGFGYGLK